MKELEIVMNIDTLEVYKVIDYDREASLDITEERSDYISLRQELQVTSCQLNLFEDIDLANTS